MGRSILDAHSGFRSDTLGLPDQLNNFLPINGGSTPNFIKNSQSHRCENDFNVAYQRNKHGIILFSSRVQRCIINSFLDIKGVSISKRNTIRQKVPKSFLSIIRQLHRVYSIHGVMLKNVSESVSSG